MPLISHWATLILIWWKLCEVFSMAQHCRQQAVSPTLPFPFPIFVLSGTKRRHWHMGMREHHLQQNYFCGRQWFIILVDVVACVLWAAGQDGGQAGTHCPFAILHPVKGELPSLGFLALQWGNHAHGGGSREISFPLFPPWLNQTANPLSVHFPKYNIFDSQIQYVQIKASPERMPVLQPFCYKL